MDAVTHPHPEVARMFSTRFVAVAIDTKRGGDSARQAMHRLRPLWEPSFVFLDERGRELRRFVGYRAPDEMLAELRLVDALYALLHDELDAEEEALRNIARTAPVSAPDLASEALYWAGIAAFRKSRDPKTLEAEWSLIEIVDRHGTWWQRADVFDVTPTGKRPHMNFEPTDTEEPNE